MKIARNFLAIAFVSLGISAASHAQIQQSWAVNVPFDFTVRHTSLEAGRYTVHQSGALIYLVSQKGKSANVLSNKEYLSAPSTHSSLVFQHVGNDYSLAQVKNMGSATELDTVVNNHRAKPLEARNAAESVEVMAVGTR